jgi:hypothetical protein
MGERKVLNKYIPPDFDPALVPRGTKLSSKDGTVPVRMMLPFSIQCSTCHTFLYRGRKFNSKKEPMGGPDGRYLGITRWRFYIKCTACARPITFLTDPKNADYEMESGGTRNYELQRDRADHEKETAEQKERSEKEDPMKALEHRVLESQYEMADMENLEQIKAMNARHVKLLAGVGTNKKKEDKKTEEEEDLLTAEDEALIRSIQFGKKRAPAAATEIKRLDEQDELRLEQRRMEEAAALIEKQKAVEERANNGARSAAVKPLFKVVRRKRVADDDESSSSNNNNGKVAKKADDSSPKEEGLAGLLGGYGSGSSSDEE